MHFDFRRLPSATLLSIALCTVALSTVFLSTVALIADFAAPARAEETALDRYIAKPDPSYHWKLVARHPGKGQTTYVIWLTSQTWRTAGEVKAWHKAPLAAPKPGHNLRATQIRYLLEVIREDYPHLGDLISSVVTKQ